ncbi:MAG: M14 family metallopeptidase [Bacillota bacterium]
METLYTGSRGPYVKLVQSLLKRIGYDSGPVDGVFGSQTRQAVIAFQMNNGLTPDGIVGPATWRAFNTILRGYANYTVRPGDTYTSLARRFYTTVNAIITANPGVDPNFLQIGQTVVVPYGIDVVFTDIDYTYDIMEMNIRALKARHPFLETGVIGKSVMGKNIYYIRLGAGSHEVSYNGSHHANEWITSPFLMKFIENFLKAYVSRASIRGYDIAALWNRSSMYIVPMVNPDGVDLVLGAISPDNPYYRNAVSLNRTGQPIPRVWKANIRGTDLNLNYPAGWERGVEYERSLGTTGPGPANYGGPAPLSEPETLAMAEFTRRHSFTLAIAFHTQGEVIFWQYLDLAPPEALPIAERFSRINGYAVLTNPPEASFGGYKDWFIQEYRRPGYTFEVGRGVKPIGTEQFNTIYNQNEGVLLEASVI